MTDKVTRPTTFALLRLGPRDQPNLIKNQTFRGAAKLFFERFKDACLESVDPPVVDVLLEVAGVHDVEDPVDGERRLRDVRRHHDLPAPRGRRLKDGRLGLQRQGGVNRDRDLGKRRKAVDARRLGHAPDGPKRRTKFFCPLLLAIREQAVSTSSLPGKKTRMSPSVAGASRWIWRTTSTAF